MKIAIAFFGITRSLEYTYQSIGNNVINPAKCVGDVKIYAHFYENNLISNPRSGEYGVFDTNNWKYLKPDVITMEPANLCLEQWDYENLCKHGDAWGDNFKSLKNLIHQLSSLRNVTLELLKDNPDVVIFCRPDLVYFGSFKYVIDSAIQSFNKNNAYIPFWQWYGGLNDRFAICTGVNAVRAYGLRIERINKYIDAIKVPLHSERLLRFSLSEDGIVIKPILNRATRVRLGGRFESESFSWVRRMGWKVYITDWINQHLKAL